MAIFPIGFTTRGAVLSTDKVLIANNTDECHFSTVEELLNVLSAITIDAPTFTGTTTVERLNINGDDVTASADELNTLDGITASVAELNFCTGVTSAIQTQLNAKAATSSLSGYATTASVALKANITNPEFLGAVAIGGGFTAGEEYAILDLNSTTKALLIPRMTTTQRNALNPSEGMIIYNVTLGLFQGRTSTGWTTL